MNIYEKLQECRMQIATAPMKRSGMNKFSNYTYFELGDFMPQTITAMNKLKMTSVFGFGAESASLTIIDCEKPEDTIVFSSPNKIEDLKGMNGIQTIGASQTYMRRYLYTMALEISEFDIVNGIDPTENTKQDDGASEVRKAEESQISEEMAVALASMANRKGVPVNSIAEKFKVASISVLNGKQYMESYRLLDVMPDKKVKTLEL